MTKIKRIIKEAINDFFRNGLLSATTTLIMTLALLCVGIFLVVFLSTNQAIADLKGKIDIVINFKDEASESLIQQLKSELLQRPNITSVRYISKDDALKEFKSRESIKVEVRQIISKEDNPLPRGLQVQSVDLTEYDYISALTKNPVYASFIDSSSHDDNKTLIENINDTTKVIEKIGLALSGIFIAIAALVVFNTIRLTVHFRSKEIEVMRLVGASETYVRTPFLIEGFMYGLISTIVSSALIYLGIFISQSISSNNVFDRLVDRVAPVYLSEFWFITLSMFIVGAVIGLGASWLSIRKNVKM
ncbi:MAG: permease-like cell division protein FtsX [bacterium]